MLPRTRAFAREGAGGEAERLEGNGGVLSSDIRERVARLNRTLRL